VLTKGLHEKRSAENYGTERISSGLVPQVIDQLIETSWIKKLVGPPGFEPGTNGL
jgi:hypothetical protein